MEIEYRWFTMAQSQSFSPKDDPSGEIKTTLNNAARCAQNATPNDYISLLALSNNFVAGRISFTYGHISTPDMSIRVAAASDLYTNSDFRGHGIGTMLISKSLEIGIPCFYTGISGQAMPLYKRLGFSFIDQSPIYQMPITPRAILREWRNRVGRITETEQEPFQAAKVLNKTLRVRKAAIKQAAKSTNTIQQKDIACSITGELMKRRHNRFQVPWDKTEMLKAANGENSKFKLLVFKDTVEKNNSAHFATAYKKIESIRLPRTSKKLPLCIGVVNEIYPPPTTIKIAIDILCILTANAKTMGFDNLSFCAMTPILEDACQTMGLNTYHSKSIAIQPVNMEESLTKSVLAPKNWWSIVITI